MKKDRLLRVNESLRREIARSLFRVIIEPSFDLSAVSITHVMTSSDLKTARVLVSIRNHEDQRGHILGVMEKNRGEIQHEVAEHLQLKYTPRLSFVLDTSIEEGDRILGLLSRIETGPSAPTDDAADSDDAHHE